MDQRPRRAGGGLSLVRAPVSGWAWRATTHLMLGFPVGIVTFVVSLVLVVLTAGLLITAVLAVVTLALLIWCTRGFTAMQRSRFRAVLGIEIAPIPRRHEGTWLRRLLTEARAADTWRQVAYHLLAFVIGTVGFVLMTVAWSVGIATVTVVAYARALPTEGIFGWDMRSPVTLAGLTALGVVLLLVAPWLGRGLAGLDAAAAVGLLGPSRSEELARRVDTLTLSREGALDAADAERRRIERDLHDGAQQRLVSLAMRLGMARAKLVKAPDASDAQLVTFAEDARRAVEEAHDEAKQALTELRGFIRGLHPAVLDNRGLDAALSGIAARAPLPVGLRVDIPARCSPTVEAVAYFVVSEALTNVARHADATRAEVVVERIGDRLRVVVADDGRGGASPDRGSGLRGLAQRASSVDGTLRVDSPAGGPTVIVAELPCEL
jgi:signal transduction histidine kinase